MRGYPYPLPGCAPTHRNQSAWEPSYIVRSTATVQPDECSRPHIQARFAVIPCALFDQEKLKNMPNPFEDDTHEFLVLVNDEGQYSLWPAHLDIPMGWDPTGPRGARQKCLDWIDQNWTDMRPKSVVRQMAEDA